MRKPVIVGNWKMNKTCNEAVEFINGIESVLHSNATFGVGVPFTAIKDSVNAAKDLVVAAQNVHFEASGAYTGEVSVSMLKELNVTHVIIGHSERREYFGETDETVNAKAKVLLENNMTPILCFGETEAQFDANETETVIRTQLQKGLNGLSSEGVASLVLAYEPIWAIGTGKSATKEIAQNCCAIVRDEVRKLFGDDAANKVRIQYGGSVKPDNIKEYMAMEDIDGALIGGASLKVDSFTEIVNAVK